MISKVYSKIKPGDFVFYPTDVNKSFELTNVDFETTSSGYRLWTARHCKTTTPLGDERVGNDPVNSLDNTYMHDLWQYIDHRYYKHPYDRVASQEHWNANYTYKYLGATASIIAVPTMDYGMQIKPKSVELIGNSVTIKDDGNGNLYMPDLSWYPSIIAGTENLIGYWGFNDEIRRFKYETGTIESGTIKYRSTPIANSVSHCSKIEITKGALITTGDLAERELGYACKFGESGSVFTEHLHALNLEGDFSICFWYKSPAIPAEESYIITKEGTFTGNTSGLQDNVNASGQTQKSRIVQKKTLEKPTNIYPYRIGIDTSGYPFFERSDGTSVKRVTATTVALTTDETWNYVACVKRGTSIEIWAYSTVTLPVYGLEDSAPDVSGKCYNDRDVIFGNNSLVDHTHQFVGTIDEVRFYNTALSANKISHLYSGNYALQHTVVGNVFYRNGLIVLSPIHQHMLNWLTINNWRLKYKGTHTIYTYEVLCRIPKGAYNISQNPSARKSFDSDLLSDEMTGSMFPYATTVGLYNSNKELLAVAKLSQPLQMRDDVPININVQFDV